jgi:plastocyanin
LPVAAVGRLPRFSTAFFKERRMKSAHIFAFGCVLSVVGLLGIVFDDVGAAKPYDDPVIVRAKSLSFDPKKLEIQVGDSVVWSNEARTNHTATSDDDGKTFETDEIAPGQSSKPVKFEKPGEFKYHCKVHGKSMSGTIVVKGRAK